jgi:hypothetical protein
MAIVANLEKVTVGTVIIHRDGNCEFYSASDRVLSRIKCDNYNDELMML